MTQESITEIVNAAKEGDAQAFTSLVVRFQDMAMGLAYGQLGDAEMARDAAQEAFIDVFLHLDQLRQPEAFVGWFRRVVMKHCNRQVRRKKIYTTDIQEAAYIRNNEPAPDEILIDHQEQGLIRDSIEKLPQHERMVIAMHYLAGEPLKAISSLLEIPLGTVKKRLYSARQRLKKRRLDMAEKTLKNMRPSANKEFTSTIRFFHALRTGDCKSVRDILDQHPEFVNSRVTWEMQDTLNHNFPNVPGPSPLQWAIMRDDVNMVDLLLERGAPLVGSLFGAVTLGSEKAVRKLLEKGADSNEDTGRKVTALHAAAMLGLGQMVELLVSNGADTELLSHQGLRPIDYAQIRGHSDVVKVLEEMGSIANPTIGYPRTGQPMDTTTGIFWTGIKALDLFAPIRCGSIVRFDSIPGVGSNVCLIEIIHNSGCFSNIPTVLVNCRGGLGPRSLVYQEPFVSGHIHYVENDPDKAYPDGNTAHRAVDLAKNLLSRGCQHVLMVFLVQSGYESEVESIFPSLNQDDDSAITTILEWPLPAADNKAPRNFSPPVQTRICFDATLRERHHYPCIHPLWSQSSFSTLESIGEKHYEIQTKARKLLKAYRELNPTLDPDIVNKATGDQLQTIVQAQRLQAFLTQPFHGAEPFTGDIGVSVSKQDLLNGVERILNGEFDHIPVRNFLMKGTIESALDNKNS